MLEVIKETFENFDKIQEKYYQQNAKVYPVHSNRSSEIGHPCLRYLVYLRTRWQDQLPPPPKLLKAFKAGREDEELAKQQLREMGFIIRETIYTFQDPQFQLTGAIDCFISHPNFNNIYIPAEIKAVNQFTHKKINTPKDFITDKPHYLRKWYYQLQAYFYLVSLQKQEFEKLGVFVLRNKNNTELKIILSEIDYEIIEDILKRCETINQHVANNTLPERITDLSICSQCPFRHICLPPIDGGQGLDAEIDEEVLNAVKRLHELEGQLEEFEELQSEYEQLKEFLKERLKPKFEAGATEIFAGNYIVKAQKIERIQIDTKKLPAEIKEQYATKLTYYKIKVIEI